MAKFVDNSSVSGDIYNGRLEYTGDGTEAEGNPWLPLNQTEIETRYIQDGTIELDALDGKGSLYINTNWIALSDSAWVLSCVYDVVLGTSYKMYSLHYNGNGTADVWYGDNENPLTLLTENTGLSYLPPITDYKIYTDPILPVIPTVEFSTIPNITTTDYIEVTLTFNTAPVPTFSLGDLTYDTNNGNISNLTVTSNPKIWTFRYTANIDINDITNIITANTNYWDIFGNKCTTPVVSNNFEINTGTEVRIEINGDFITDDAWYIYISPDETNGTITHDPVNQRFYFNNIKSNSGIYQALTVEVPMDYDIEFQISGYNDGLVTARLEGQDPTYVYRDANGIFIQTITNDPNTLETLWVQGYYGVGFTGYIEYIKVTKT